MTKGSASQARILVIGRQGQLARAFSDVAGNQHQIVERGRPELDIRDIDSIQRALDDVQPQIVINAAAYTNVDGAESDRDAAFATNETGSRNVARLCARAGLPLVTYSTDYVFPGTSETPYRESDATGPINVYGASKLAGELATAEELEAHFIFRISWVYYNWGKNFVATISRLAREREELRIVDDQVGRPTYAADIVAATLGCVPLILARELAPGIYHMSPQGHTSWFGFASTFVPLLSEGKTPLARLTPIRSSEYPTPARRPQWSCLDGRKFETATGLKLPHWEDSLRLCLARGFET